MVYKLHEKKLVEKCSAKCVLHFGVPAYAKYLFALLFICKRLMYLHKANRLHVYHTLLDKLFYYLNIWTFSEIFAIRYMLNPCFVSPVIIVPFIYITFPVTAVKIGRYGKLGICLCVLPFWDVKSLYLLRYIAALSTGTHRKIIKYIFFFHDL